MDEWFLAKWLAEVSASLHRLHAKVNVILQQQGEEVADLTQLQTDVGHLGDAVQGAVSELQRLDALVTDLRNSSTDPQQQAQIDAIDAQVGSVASALSTAVQSSVGAAPAQSAPPEGQPPSDQPPAVTGGGT